MLQRLVKSGPGRWKKDLHVCGLVGRLLNSDVHQDKEQREGRKMVALV